LLIFVSGAAKREGWRSWNRARDKLRAAFQNSLRRRWRVIALTIRDIARMAGVSRSTVSLAINDSPKVSEDTKRRIMEICEAVDYQPNAMARGLVAKISKVACLVIPEISQVFSDYYFSETVNGVLEAVTARGYHLLIETAGRRFREEKIALRLYRAKRMDAVLFVGALTTDSYIIELAEKGCPVVLINSTLPKIPTVLADNVSGAIAAAGHLAGLGHKRVGFIKGLDVVTTGLDRAEGFHRARERFRLDDDPDLIAYGNFSEDSGYEAMKKLLALSPRPTAVFTTNDMMAIGALRAIREAGLRVPQDIALAGGDDIVLARYISPRLTTIRQNMNLIGRLATDMILDSVEQRAGARSSRPDANAEDALPPTPELLAVERGGESNGETPRTVVPTQLIIRESCGATPRNGS
jgi:LacI family transcriptional regulator